MDISQKLDAEAFRSEWTSLERYKVAILLNNLVAAVSKLETLDHANNVVFRELRDDIKNLKGNPVAQASNEVEEHMQSILDTLICNTFTGTPISLSRSELGDLRSWLLKKILYYDDHRLYYHPKPENTSKARTTDKEQPLFWKLHCKKRDSNYKDQIRTFKGNRDRLLDHIDTVNYGNYSYSIVDFEQIKVDDTV